MVQLQNFQSIFAYGEVGDSLGGFKDSEIARQSAKKITNFYITEMGTLKIAKQYTQSTLGNDLIVAVRETKYDFFIVFERYKMYTVNKTSLNVLYSLNFASGKVLNEYSNINIFNDFISIQSINGVVDVYALNASGNLGTTNFFETVKLPFQQKQDVGIDVYKCFKGTDGKIKPELMATFNEKPELSIIGKVVYLKNSGIKIDRLYEQYKSLITVDQVADATEGMTFAVFKSYKITNGTLGYYLDNHQITWLNRTADNTYGGFYYTGAQFNFNTSADGNGTLIYGVLENFLAAGNVVDMVEFQSRLVIASRDKLYFSEILNYNNFVPDINESAAFFIKPSTIDGNQPRINKLLAGNGLNVICTDGIIVIGYGNTINGINMGNVKIAGNIQPTNMCTLIENILYYVDINGLLRAIVPDISSGLISFNNLIVEKYDTRTNNIKYLSKGIINEDGVLIVTPNSGDEFYVYTTLGEGLFRRYSLKMNTTYPIIGRNSDLITENKYLKLSKNNVVDASIILNIPFIQTKDKGIYLNDFEQMYNRIVVNTLANKGDIKTMDINGYPIQNLSTTVGNYNIYSFTGALSIIDLTINIKTNGNTNHVEMRGINTFIK